MIIYLIIVNEITKDKNNGNDTDKAYNKTAITVLTIIVMIIVMMIPT